jgi:hypothetical protein
MEVNQVTTDQKEVWDVMRPHLAGATSGQTQEQAVNFAVLSFLVWCELDGLGQPTEAAIRAEFEEAGMPERFPELDWWRSRDE